MSTIASSAGQSQTGLLLREIILLGRGRSKQATQIPNLRQPLLYQPYSPPLNAALCCTYDQSCLFSITLRFFAAQ